MTTNRICSSTITLFVGIVLLMVPIGACKSKKSPEPKLPAPAKVENAIKEGELSTVRLTSEAEQRLGIATAPVEYRELPQLLTLSGETMIPPGGSIIVTAPISGTLESARQGDFPVVGLAVGKGEPLFRVSPYLAPERDLGVQLERDSESLTERVAAARLRRQRADLLAAEKAGSLKAAEQAREELAVAETDLKAAKERLTRFRDGPLASGMNITIRAPLSGTIARLLVGNGQAVSSGAPLLEITSLSNLLIRVPVYVDELERVARRSPARIHRLDRGLETAAAVPERIAIPVKAPPTADPAAATADLYFAIQNVEATLSPGQRVGVTLTLKSSERNLTLPWSAVLHDLQGGTWVYENTAPQTFVRRQVEVRYVSNGVAVLGRAPAAGSKIVITGAAELFGTEFGAGK